MLFSANVEKRIALGCVLLGLIVSVVFSPKDEFFLPNLAYFWGSQLGVLIFVLMCRPNAAIVSGVALVLASYLALYGTWVLNRAHADGLIWLGFFMSLPGAAAGGLLAANFLREKPRLIPLKAGSIAAAIVGAGLLINQIVVCSTVMHCGKYPCY